MSTPKIAPIIIAILLAGCGPSSPAPLSQADTAAIEAVTDAFVTAMQKGDWDAASMTYAQDAILLPPNSEAVTGRAAIRQYLSGFPPVTRFEIKNLEVQGAGDVAVARGTYVMTLQPPGMPPIEDHGKYIDTRKKQADGTWLYQWDIFNSSVPLPGTGH